MKSTKTKTSGAKKATNTAELPTLSFASSRAFSDWLADHHDSSRGIWLRLGRKASGSVSIAYAEAVDVALAWGWIDGQKQRGDDASWLQKFTPRGTRSVWSKINREKALALIEAGAMQPAGLAEVERAKRDGRWDLAYDPASRATVPDDLQTALAKNARAAAFFVTLNARNRYAVLWRVQTAKKAETRQKRIAGLVAMLARGEKVHP
ncbi:MAG TPA: YdeI/OmpD-associated family protein [Vicinamibacterales bacterium]|nr:YdeI/OmpD-associated family protein [Vicinamibacterales bacterium]